MKRLLPLLVCLSAFVPAVVRADEGADWAALAEAEVVPEDATASEVLALCRAMVPADVVIGGRVNRRSRHGKTIASYGYTLTRRAGVTDVKLTDEKGGALVLDRQARRIADTDVTWDDLTLGFLWWPEVSFDASAEAASLSGIICKVLLIRNGERAFRAWIDRRTGALVQAAEIREVDGVRTTVREVFCTSLKKFGERWSPRNIEVGPPGAKYRTKIIIDRVEAET